MKNSCSLYEPIKEQFLVLVEYINILEQMRDLEQIREIVLLMELINNTKRQCDIYLNYQLVKQGKRNG